MSQKKKTFLRLFRKQGQRIIVGDPPDHIVLRVGKTTEWGTELEFLAPHNVAIDREEIAQQKRRLDPQENISTA